MKIDSDADLVDKAKIAIASPRFSPERQLWMRHGLEYIERTYGHEAGNDCNSHLYPRIETPYETVDDDNERIKWILRYIEVNKL